MNAEKEEVSKALEESNEEVEKTKGELTSTITPLDTSSIVSLSSFMSPKQNNFSLKFKQHSKECEEKALSFAMLFAEGQSAEIIRQSKEKQKPVAAENKAVTAEEAFGCLPC